MISSRHILQRALEAEEAGALLETSAYNALQMATDICAGEYGKTAEDVLFGLSKSEGQERPLHIVNCGEDTRPRVAVLQAEKGISGLVTAASQSRMWADLVNTSALIGSMQQLGAARGMFDRACAYLNNRVLDGRPLSDREAIRESVGELYVCLFGAVMACRKAIGTASSVGDTFDRATIAARLMALRASQIVSAGSMRLHGGVAMIAGDPMDVLALRQNDYIRIYGSAVEWRLRLARMP
ncbi:acyl-CoA dehydrogenase family protein [Hyphomonas sp.]|uniref:acyl-CoA dehydrogenase family protein n=1 Tax=Hyphomonas sp. TaxID=87 RepID=UPI00352889AE